MKNDIYRKNILSIENQLKKKNIELQGTPRRLKIDGIIISGIGGSGIPGEIFKNMAHKLGLDKPVVLWKNFGIPEVGFKNPLFIFLSHSGNTKEVLSGIELAVKKYSRKRVCAGGSGGKLEIFSKKEKVLFAKYPGGDLVPRNATGYAFYALIALLSSYIPGVSAEDYSWKKDDFKRYESLGKKVAGWCYKKVPLIYTTTSLSPIGTLFKIGINESAKQPAFANILPEICHNEIVSFRKKMFNSVVLLISGKSTTKEEEKTIKKIETLLQKKNIPCKKIKINGKNLFETTWNGLLLSYWTSFFLSSKNNVDFQETMEIDYLKNITKF